MTFLKITKMNLAESEKTAFCSVIKKRNQCLEFLSSGQEVKVCTDDRFEEIIFLENQLNAAWTRFEMDGRKGDPTLVLKQNRNEYQQWVADTLTPVILQNQLNDLKETKN